MSDASPLLAEIRRITISRDLAEHRLARLRTALDEAIRRLGDRPERTTP